MIVQSCTESAAEIEREIRFAVVIYGGVSLAVYINGITQELLHLVRSTAIDDLSQLSPVELVYRRLATKVGTPSPPASVSGFDKPLGNSPGKAGLRPAVREEIRSRGGKPKESPTLNRPHEDLKTIYSRFVVDILSGTSAGGINAIYLAKALVNNQSIASLASMWIKDADLGKLLNDKKVSPSFLRQNPPPSLLSSSWMYLRLLTAFQAMSEPNLKPDPAKLVPDLVQDLDLYCTTTDLHGIPVDIALTDENVKEQRYRNFYQFKCRKGRVAPVAGGAVSSPNVINTLSREMDPFLAFAARCTSSFPFAFEPMELEDIISVLENEEDFRDYRGSEAALDPDLIAFFGSKIAALPGAGKFAEICRIYQSDAARRIPFSSRPFGDGGYLDNKPFTYAVETIKTRHAVLPVDRKLVYIEPSPEHFDPAPAGPHKRPNAVENSLDALVELPRYETIRQDIESVIDWNNSIARLHRVIDFVNADVLNSDTRNESLKVRGGDGNMSVSHPTYWRLRLSGTADQLGARMADAIDVSPSSAQGQALRSIAGAWRSKYFPHPSSQQRFLDLFDFDYCERAIRFLRTRLQQLPEGTIEEKTAKKDSLTALAKLTQKFMSISNDPLPLDLKSWTDHPQAFDYWTQYLSFIVDPKAAARMMGIQDPLDPPRPETIFPPFPDYLEDFLAANVQGRDSRVNWLFTEEKSVLILVLKADANGVQPVAIPFSQIAGLIAGRLIKLFSDSQLGYDASFVPPLQPSDGETSLQGFFREMEPLFAQVGSGGRSGLELFRLQDAQIYPIIFGTTLGEFEPVELFRISPQDTRPIAGVSPPGVDGNPALRGASLGAFGAFLDQRWRLSDMLRGRLDGAERLITAVLPDSDLETMVIREELIKEAQEAIAIEWKQFQDGLHLDLPTPVSAH